MQSNIRYEQEVSIRSVLRDTSPLGQRISRFLRSGESAAMTVAGTAGAAFVFPAISEVCFSIGALVAAWSLSVQKRTGLPMQVPMSANTLDPKEIDLATKKPTKGKGIIYIGNDRDTNEEIWLTDTQARTHMMFLGTTGSGKTEFLLSVVFNGLIHGSGLIYVDGKADNSLYGKIYSMARAMGREDDVLLINFQTGAKDIFGAQPRKMSNSLNPFAVGSSGMLSQLVVGLMSGGKDGKQDVWSERAISFVEALLKPLVYLRDNYGLLLDVEVIRNYFNLEPLVALLTENMQRTKNDFGADEWREREDARFPGIGLALSGLASYIDNLPGYNQSKPVSKQESIVSEQHGYITMQLVRTFNSLADTYGYIMKTPLAEIDFLDVFINRRILVVLLPALEKSPPELTNLGRIIVASIKATMAVGLGADVEGDWAKVIDAKPTTAPSPYMSVFDEYGYYAVEGFAVVPAQARSLGFSAIFAGQDLPAFEKASKSEAESTLGNTTTKFCGKLECTKTYEYFKTIAGEGYYSRMGGFQNQANTVLSQNYMDTQAAQVEKIARVSLDDLRAQISGQWHMFVADRIVRIDSFYSNPRRVTKLRTNHFIPVEPPSDEHARVIREAIERCKTGIKSGFEVERMPTPELARLVKCFPAETRGFDGAANAFADFYRQHVEASNSVDIFADSLELDEDDESDEGIFDEFCEVEDPQDRADRTGDGEIDFSTVADDDMLFGDIDDDEGEGPQPVPNEDDIRAAQRISSGLLNREEVEHGVAQIEKKIGRREAIADALGATSASILAEATRYPVAPPAQEPNIEDFVDIATTLEQALGYVLEDAQREAKE